MTDHYDYAIRDLRTGGTSEALVHAALAVADRLAELTEQQALANLIAAQHSGVPLTGYQRDAIDAFIRGQLQRIGCDA